jgi:cytochrome c oxidase assembly protein subunit 15
MVTSRNTDSRWPHRLAVLLVCATFPLIWIGGLVTTTNSGMAFPRWLTIEGRFFLFYPLGRWLAGPSDQFLEHGHRLPAVAVGLLTILLAVALWRCESRGWMRWLGVGAVAGVCFQGLLGGLRVDLNQRTLAMIHGCVGPLFFALCVAIAAFTSRWWTAPAKLPARSDDAKLLRFAAVTTLLAYLQLVLGAWLRHMAAGSTAGAFRIVVLFHLVLAAAVAGHALYLAHVVFWRRRQGVLVRPALGLAALVLLQVALGGGTWINKYGWPDGLAQYDFAQRFLIVPGGAAQMWITTAHVAVGSLILVTAWLLSLRVWRLARAADGQPAARRGRRLAGEVLA